MTAAMITPSPAPVTPRSSGQGPPARALYVAPRSSVEPIVDGHTLRRSVAVALAIGALVALVSAVSSRTWPVEPVATGPAVQVVEPGDTLWGLVRETYPEGDIGPIVAEVLSERSGQPLRVGETVIIATE